MQKFRLKITMLRTNPLVIREFTFPSEYTLEQLNEAVLILFNWKCLKGVFRIGDDVLAYQEKIGEVYIRSAQVMQNENSCIDSMERPDEIKVNNKTLALSITYKGGADNQLAFRIDFLEVIDNADEKVNIRVVRFRGKNPPMDIKDNEEYNRLAHLWGYAYAYYDNELVKNHPIYEYNFDLKKTNFMLSELEGTIKMCPEIKRLFLALAPDEAPNAIHLLNAKTIEELKEKAELLGYKIKEKYKEDVVRVYLEILKKPEVIGYFMNLITTLDLKNMERLLNMDFYSEDRGDGLGVIADLCDMGYAGIQYQMSSYRGDKFVITNVFEEGLMRWCLTEDTTDFMLYVKIRTVVKGAIMLYGYLDRASFEEVVQGSLGQVFSRKRIDRLWEYVLKLPSNPVELDLEITKDEKIYNSRLLYEPMIMYIKESARRYGSRRYIPTYEELEKMSTYDVTSLVNTSLYALKNAVDQLLYHHSEQEREICVSDIIIRYRARHETKEILEYLFKTYQKPSVRVTNLLQQAMDSVQPYIRQMDRLGNTDRESRR